MSQTLSPAGGRMVGLLLLSLPLALAAVARGQAPAPQSDAATITYRRVFQGSTPEFIEIKVQQDGAALADLRRLSEEAAPQAFEGGPVPGRARPHRCRFPADRSGPPARPGAG